MDDLICEGMNDLKGVRPGDVKDNRKGHLRGSLTIECTMVMPVILSAIILIMTLALYMYNDTVVSCACINSAMAGLYIINDSNGDIVKAAEDEAILLLDNKLVGEDSVKASVKANPIYVESCIDMNMNLPYAVPFIGDELREAFDIHHDYKVMQINPASVLRDVNKYNVYKELTTKFSQEETKDE